MVAVAVAVAVVRVEDAQKGRCGRNGVRGGGIWMEKMKEEKEEEEEEGS